MALYDLHSLAIIALLYPLLLQVIYRAFRAISCQRLRLLDGCLSAPKVRRGGLPFGLDNLVILWRASRENRVLEEVDFDFRSSGRTTMIQRQLNRRMVVTCEPDNIRTILSLKSDDYNVESRNQAFGPLISTGILVSDGADWAHSRAVMRRNFVRSQLANFEPLEQTLQSLISLLPRDGVTVDLQPLFLRYTLDIASELQLGQSMHSLRQTAASDGKPTRIDEFKEAMGHSGKDVARRHHLGVLRYFFIDLRARKSHRTCQTFVDQLIEEALQQKVRRDSKKSSLVSESSRASSGPYVALHEWLEQTTDRRRLRDEVITMLLTSGDTTASLLGNLFSMLARHPTVWQKLRAEISSTLQGRRPTYEELPRLQYLRYCINETLRLMPPIPLVDRVAKRDTVLPVGGGPDGQSPLLVPQGSQMVCCMYSLHRRVNYFGSDAKEFRPDRWATRQPGEEFMPFGTGPRACVGRQLALTVTEYVTIRLVQLFPRLEGRDAQPWQGDLSAMLLPKNGVKVALWSA
ncbi:cytochrome P450 [Aspergillus phoenicis ATCC 13157]|uniref:Cytochrome P450 n=1 Tax=Aspergillus phoenicis ATCC 13157 TaxID=1353007 RepID=A0A370P941_ASPPH|nr:cytochrome P450 [Aspergillus phoenicis ATCC 13157]